MLLPQALPRLQHRCSQARMCPAARRAPRQPLPSLQARGSPRLRSPAPPGVRQGLRHRPRARSIRAPRRGRRYPRAGTAWRTRAPPAVRRVRHRRRGARPPPRRWACRAPRPRRSPDRPPDPGPARRAPRGHAPRGDRALPRRAARHAARRGRRGDLQGARGAPPRARVLQEQHPPLLRVERADRDLAPRRTGVGDWRLPCVRWTHGSMAPPIARSPKSCSRMSTFLGATGERTICAIGSSG